MGNGVRPETHLIVHELQGERRLPHAAAAHHDHLVEDQGGLVLVLARGHGSGPGRVGSGPRSSDPGSGGPDGTEADVVSSCSSTGQMDPIGSDLMTQTSPHGAGSETLYLPPLAGFSS